MMKPEPREYDFDHDDHYEDACPNCGDEGVIYDCFEEYACIDPEGGCEFCMRRCDWCRPVRRASLKEQEQGR